MNNKTKTFTVVLISAFLILGIFAQTNNLASSLAAAEEKEDSPTLSNYNEIYDLGGGNTMNILSDDTVDNTVTTLNAGTDSLPIDSTFTEGASGSSKVVINNSAEISTTTGNKTILKDKDTGFNATIDNGFNLHMIDNIQAYDYRHDGISDVSASAQLSDVDDERLNYFDIYDAGTHPWWVTYDWDNIWGVEALNVNNTVYILQHLDWIVIDFVTEAGIIVSYNISLIDGSIYYSIDFGPWLPTTSNIYSDIEIILPSISGVSFVYINETIIITDYFFWEIIITVWDWQVNIISYLFTFSITWIYLLTISIYWGYWFYVFYLYVIYELLYIFIYPDYDWKIEYYYTYIVIVWIYLQITIWYSHYYIHWVVIFWWNWWIIKIQWWFITINFVWIFIDFIIWIEYYYLYWHWIYIFYVPTPVLPNLLQIDMIKTLFTNTTFDITILVKDIWDNPISGATVSGTWNGLSIGTVTDNGDGTYDFTLAAILVSPGQPGKWLNLTASKMGYADATHDTEIAVDPDAVNNKHISGTDESPFIPGPSILLIGVVSSFAIVGVVKYLKKKRNIIKH